MPLQPQLFRPEVLRACSRLKMRRWHLFDADKQVVGRVAQDIAKLLVGKHQPTWDRSHDHGDTVVVVNCENIKFTGKKRMERKLYRKHSGYPGGLKTLTARQVMDRDPSRILLLAVKGMLPKDKHRKHRLSRCKVYEGGDHPHLAQFKLDVKKEGESREVVIPTLPDPAHQKMLDYWRGMGDEGLKLGMRNFNVSFESDLVEKAQEYAGQKVEKEIADDEATEKK